MLNLKLNFFSWTSISAFAVINCMLYSWAFWNDFNINILEFTSVNDLLPSILFSIALPIIIIITLSIAQHVYNIIANHFIMMIMKYLKPSHVIQHINNNVHKISSFFAVFGLLSGLLTLLFTKPDTQKLLLLWIPASLIFFILLRKVEKFPIEIGKHKTLILMLISVLPGASYTMGYVKAYKVKHGIETYIVVSDSPCIDGDYRYVGSTSSKAFAVSLVNQTTCIFNYNYLKLQKEKDETSFIPLHTDRL